MNIEGYEKERNNWVREVLWIEEIQEYGLQRFLSECPVVGLDKKTLYVIRDCIEWQNEALSQGVVEIGEILSGLNLVDKIIWGDLKWFYKHYTGEDNDSVALVEDVIKEIQKEFLEIQKGRHLQGKIFQMLRTLKLC